MKQHRLTRPKIVLWLMAVFVLATAPLTVYAWSNRISEQTGRVLAIGQFVEIYRNQTGQYPSHDPQKSFISYLDKYARDYWTTVYKLNASGHPLDYWGRPLIYRVPGRSKPFDLYSVGEDGIDQQGQQDDISYWTRVNDGYYWKKTWPAGRRWIIFGIIAPLIIVLATHRLAWRYRLWLACISLSVGACVGSQLQMHPGHVPSRNVPLTAIFLVGLVVSIYGGWKLVSTLCRILWRRVKNLCLNCAYDLRGNPDATSCPECGELIKTKANKSDG